MVLRRTLASSSLITPAARSASIAICLPGIASREKRAATSAIRVEPFVITMKLMMTRIVKTMIPMMKSPLTMKLEKPSMTLPAAPGPVCPSLRINLVEETLSARRSMVTTRRIVGKELNSSGVPIQRATIRIRTESERETASPRSSKKGGSGTKSIARMRTTPRAKAMSRLLEPKRAMLKTGRPPIFVSGVAILVRLSVAGQHGAQRRGGIDRVDLTQGCRGAAGHFSAPVE